MRTTHGIRKKTRILPALLLVFAAAEATAQLRYCNRAPYPIDTAVGRAADGGQHWVAEGWWTLQPGECAWVVGGSRLRYRYYYAYAEADGELARWARGGNSARWGGNDYFCVDSQAFNLRSDSPCWRAGRRSVGFSRLDTKDADEYTFEFWDDRHPASRKDAPALSARLRKQMEAEKQRKREAEEVRRRLAAESCDDMPPFRMPSRPYSASLLGRTVTLSPTVTVDFQGGGFNTTRVEATAEIGLKELASLFRQQTSRQALGIGNNNCNHRFHLEHDVGASQGKMTTKVSLRYELWACCKKCVPCGFFRMCDAKTRSDTFRSEVKIVWAARPVNQNRGIEVTTEAWTRSETEGFVTGVANLLGLGDELHNRIQREVNQGISGIVNQLRWGEDSLIPNGVAFRMKITSASFKMSGGHPALVVKAAGEIPKSQSCKVYSTLTGSSSGRVARW